MKNNKLADFIHLQFVVLIFSFTAVLGKLITLPADALVLWRLIFAIIGLFVYLKITKKKLFIERKKLITYLIIGSVVGLHWLAFFGAIKLSTISITLVVMSSTTLFTSILEPLILKQKFNSLQFLFGIIIIGAISMIFSFELEYALGIIVAIASSILAALFTVLNKKYTQNQNPNIASFYELSGGLVVLLIYILLFGNRTELTVLPSSQDFIWLILLGLVCTSYAYSASVKVMRTLSAYVVSLSINMEPIYGVLLAYLFFSSSEVMTNEFYIGALIVFITIIIYPIISKLKANRGVDSVAR